MAEEASRTFVLESSDNEDVEKLLELDRDRSSDKPKSEAGVNSRSRCRANEKDCETQSFLLLKELSKNMSMVNRKLDVLEGKYEELREDRSRSRSRVSSRPQSEESRSRSRSKTRGRSRPRTVRERHASSDKELEIGRFGSRPRAGPSHNMSDDESDNVLHDDTDTEMLAAGDKPTAFSVLGKLAAELEEDDNVGPPVMDELSKIVTKRFTTKLGDEKIKEKIEKYKLPENCKALKPPTLNKKLNEKHIALSRTARRNDTRIFNIQKMISRATCVVVDVTEKLHKLGTSLKTEDEGDKMKTDEIVKTTDQLVKQTADAISFLGQAQQDLSTRRRIQLASFLPKEISSICYEKIEESNDELFGEDIEKLMKDARISHRLAHSSYAPKRGQRYHPYFKKTQESGRSFLGQKGYPTGYQNQSQTKRSGRNWKGKFQN